MEHITLSKGEPLKDLDTVVSSLKQNKLSFLILSDIHMAMDNLALVIEKH